MARVPGAYLSSEVVLSRTVEIARRLRMGGCTAHLHQLHFQGFNNDGTAGNDDATSLAAIDTNFSINVDTVFGLRFELEESANCSAMNNAFTVQHNINGAGYIATTQATSGVRLVDVAGVTDGQATSDRISGSARAFVGGQYDENAATSNITLQDQHTEMHFMVELVGVDLNDADTITFRVVSNNSPLTEYHVTPTVTAVETGGGAPVTVSPGLGQATWAGFAPAVTSSDHQTVSPDVGAATWTGFAPVASVSNHQTVSPGVGAGTWTGFAPTVTGGAGLTVTPGVGQANWTGFVPTATATANQTVSPDVGAATWTGFAPTVTGGSGLTLSPGVGQGSWAGFSPTVTTTAHQTVSPGTGAVAWEGFAPTITVSGGEPAYVGPAEFSVLRADIDIPNLYRMVQTGAPRYPGSRQIYIGGQFINDDDGLEEVGAPKPPKPIPVVPAREPEPVVVSAPRVRGRQGTGVRVPKAKPVEQPVAKPRRVTVPKDDDDELAMAALMEAMMEHVY